MAEQEDGTLQPGGFSPAKGLFIYLRYMFVFSLKCITGFKHKYPYIEFNSENPKKNSVNEYERVCQETS